MVSNEEAIKKFFYEVYGYGKLDEVLKGRKSQGVNFRQFFPPTIMGTFMPYAREVDTSWNTRIKQFSHPQPSAILTTEDAKARGLIADYTSALLGLDQALPYHNQNAAFFNGMGGG